MNFTYDLISLVKQVLQIFIDKYDFGEDKANEFASNEFVYDLIMDIYIEELLEEWSKRNKGETMLFKNGLDDAEQMWKIIWKSPGYKRILNTYIKKGYRGAGVFDTITNHFHPCLKGDHYPTILIILEDNYPKLWEIHQAFIRDNTIDIKNVDDFVIKNFKLIGNLGGEDYYKISTRKY